VHVTLVPSSVGGKGRRQNQFLTSFLINDTVALDAGSIGLYGGPTEQARVKHLLLSHTHSDHLATLPVFLLNAYQGDGDCVTVYGSEVVLDCLHWHVFNDVFSPTFMRLSEQRPAYLKLQALQPGEPVELDGLRVTPVQVHHAVPTLGFIVEGKGATVIFPSDTGPTQEIWDRGRKKRNLKAVLLEAALPNSMTWLAEVAGHLTPALFAAEVAKLGGTAQFLAVHIMPNHRRQVVKELKALGLGNVGIAECGKPYTF
jgi:ribonuclease BN (tRNA processing enzyme)